MDLINSFREKGKEIKHIFVTENTPPSSPTLKNGRDAGDQTASMQGSPNSPRQCTKLVQMQHQQYLDEHLELDRVCTRKKSTSSSPATKSPVLERKAIHHQQQQQQNRKYSEPPRTPQPPRKSMQPCFHTPPPPTRTRIESGSRSLQSPRKNTAEQPSNKRLDIPNPSNTPQPSKKSSLNIPRPRTPQSTKKLSLPVLSRERRKSETSADSEHKLLSRLSYIH